MTVDRWPWASTVIQDRCRHCNAATKIQQYHPHLDNSSYKPSESSARRIICYQCRNARTKEFGSTRCAAVARFGRLRRRAVIRRILEIWFIYEGPNQCTNWIIGRCCVCLPCISDKVASSFDPNCLQIQIDDLAGELAITVTAQSDCSMIIVAVCN